MTYDRRFIAYSVEKFESFRSHAKRLTLRKRPADITYGSTSSSLTRLHILERGTRLAHAISLLEVSQEDKAQIILSKVEAEVEGLLKTTPHDDEIQRDLARLHWLQGDIPLAKVEFDALERRARLDIVAAIGSEDKTSAMWSLAKTQEDRGQPAEASRTAYAAAELAGGYLKNDFLVWERRISNRADRQRKTSPAVSMLPR